MKPLPSVHRDPHHALDLLPYTTPVNAAGNFASLLASVPVCRMTASAASTHRPASLIMSPCVSTPGQAAPAGAYGNFIGRTAGNGQCVALVRAINPGLGFTASWVRGEPVRGNTDLQPGTVIATFNANGRYTSATDGSSHTAVYLSQDSKGIQVLDQWRGQPAAVRTIPWTNPNGTKADNGNHYYTVNPG